MGMNDSRREEIAAVMAQVVEASNTLAAAMATLEQARDDEQEYFDAMPDGFKQGEKGSVSESAIAEMDDALGELQQISTAGILNALEAASDRAAEGQGIEMKITSKQAEANRWKRLPAWAKQRIERTDEALETAKKQAAQVFKPATGAEEEIVVADYAGPFSGLAVPAERVAWPKYEVEAWCEEGYGGVLIRCNGFGNRLIVEPRFSNEIVVKSAPFA